MSGDVKTKLIAVVDDDERFLEETKEMLCFHGYDVVTFSDGASILKMVKKVNPDMILLDLKMSGKSGFEVSSKLKKNPQTSKIPVLAMTGFYTEQEHTVLMRMCGINKFITKPFSVPDLLGQMESILNKEQ